MSTFGIFLLSYIECALWSSPDNSDESGGEPLDANYTRDDIAFSALLSMARDCRDFVKANEADLAACDLTIERTGHNFWLNRNGHGAGFWDEYGAGHPLRGVCNRLSDASKAYGSSDLYIGDDGKLYVT